MYLRCRQTSLSPNATKPLAWRSLQAEASKKNYRRGRLTDFLTPLPVDFLIWETADSWELTRKIVAVFAQSRTQNMLYCMQIRPPLLGR